MSSGGHFEFHTIYSMLSRNFLTGSYSQPSLNSITGGSYTQPAP